MPVLNFEADSVIGAFHDETWPEVKRTFLEHGYSVTEPRTRILGVYPPWHTPIPIRVTGEIPLMVRFDMEPSGSGTWEFRRRVTMRLHRGRSDGGWTLVVSSSPLSDELYIDPYGGGEDATPFLGSPGLEDDLQSTFHAVSEHVTWGFPSVTADSDLLVLDTASRSALQRLIGPLDGEVRRIVDEEDLASGEGGLYANLAVALVDSLDRSRGWRKAELEIQVHRKTLAPAYLAAWDRASFDLYFVRPGLDADWALLELPDEMLTDSSRSELYADVARAERRIRALFEGTVDARTWLSEYEQARGSGLQAQGVRPGT